MSPPFSGLSKPLFAACFIVVSRLACSSSKHGGYIFPEMLVDFQRIIHGYIPEDRIFRD
jgi:hypothetical protein